MSKVLCVVLVLLEEMNMKSLVNCSLAQLDGAFFLYLFFFCFMVEFLMVCNNL